MRAEMPALLDRELTAFEVLFDVSQETFSVSAVDDQRRRGVYGDQRVGSGAAVCGSHRPRKQSQTAGRGSGHCENPAAHVVNSSNVRASSVFVLFATVVCLLCSSEDVLAQRR